MLCFDGYGTKIFGDQLTLSLGRRRQDSARWVTVEIHHRKDAFHRRVINSVLTYDAKVGLQAHLEVEDGQAKGDRKAAMDQGEIQVISAMFDGGTALLYSGKKTKSIRRYWQKVRRSIKPPQ